MVPLPANLRGDDMAEISIPPGLDKIGEEITNTGQSLSEDAMKLLGDIAGDLTKYFPPTLCDMIQPLTAHLHDDFKFFRDRWGNIGQYLIDTSHDETIAERNFTANWKW
jgi:hypothetical protein